MKKVGNQFSHEKRFGQYFSGDKVATLLSLLLPQGLQYSSIIDPMAGSGDLLNAVISKATPNARVLGIEIDEPIATMCQKRLPQATIICEDAFQSKAIFLMHLSPSIFLHFIWLLRLWCCCLERK